MIDFFELCNDIKNGYKITEEQALELYQQDINILTKYSNELRDYFCKNNFEICTIINAKSGRCSENCKFCAQSSASSLEIKSYSFLNEDEVIKQIKDFEAQSINCIGLVSSGRSLNDAEVSHVCDIIAKVGNKVKICGSFGLLSEEQYNKLAKAGLSRIHNNLETSKQYFSQICTTHSFDDKIKAIKAAQNAGIFVCSGGLMGIGESIFDRISLAFSLRDLNIKSIPINILNPIVGTFFQETKTIDDEELCRIISVFRFILPDAYIRLAGGRTLLKDKGKSAFLSGANATISGNMLTTNGISIEADLALISELNYKTIK